MSSTKRGSANKSERPLASNRWKKAWQTLLGFILLFVVTGMTMYALRGLWNLFASLQKEVAAAIVAGTATILVSVASVVVARHYERSRAIEQELRERKIPMYVGFVRFWFTVLMADKMTGKRVSEKEMFSFFHEFTQQLMIWGSDEVVQRWSRYRRLLGGGEIVQERTAELMFEFENLLLAIRKDTGHRNKGIKRGDLLGLFINDVDKYASASAKTGPSQRESVI